MKRARAAPKMETESDDLDSDLFGSDVESVASDEAPASTKKQLADELDDAASTPPSSPEREVSEADEDENLAEMLAKEIGIGAEEAGILLENDKAGRSFDQLTTAEQEQLYNALSKADRGRFFAVEETLVVPVPWAVPNTDGAYVYVPQSTQCHRTWRAVLQTGPQGRHGFPSDF